MPDPSHPTRTGKCWCGKPLDDHATSVDGLKTQPGKWCSLTANELLMLARSPAQ